jgi:hypothetical protein
MIKIQADNFLHINEDLTANTPIPVSIMLYNTDTYVVNSGALVRQRTISTERPPLVGEVSAKFSG